MAMPNSEIRKQRACQGNCNRRPWPGHQLPNQVVPRETPDWCPPCQPATPPPVQPDEPGTCGVVCNDVNKHFLWPHPDANYFFQCVQDVNGDWEAITQQCGCSTFFDWAEQRCEHIDGWTPQCTGQSANQIPAECVTCPNC